MTVCYSVPSDRPGERLTVEWDRGADWDSHWVVKASGPDGHHEICRAASYTEARRHLDREVMEDRTGATMRGREEPWSFDDLEIDAQQTWEIYDPNLARLVAIFWDRDEAKAYLRWRNKKQAKARSREDKNRAEDARWAWPG